MHLVDNLSSKRDVRGLAKRIVPAAERGVFVRLIEGIVTLCGGEWTGRAGMAKRRLQVLETLSIGPKKQMLLIRCDGEKYLVATGPDSVQTIIRVEPRTSAVGLGVVAPDFGERS